ncbi:hypothetical protein [Streptomyces gobiensis]|uniref:hypothetical protein n=1 Tax=Streptomyces gobiensis TaxID=2875706 RepID=UPI001E573A5D|nr:hypothetical protein [Streptomyces gobiensis]UGY92942.1 hypothetical protein test1122_15315 [Streptomyces gobiensis]
MACSTTERVGAAMKVKNAVEKLGARESVTATARIDATPDQIYTYLQQGKGVGKGKKARENAQLLADLELAVSVGADKPLRDLTDTDRADSATAVNFGGVDVFSFKSVDRKLYVQLSLEALAKEINGTGLALKDAQELGRLTKELPSSLAAAQSALSGKWVRINPREFGEFSEVLGGEAGQHAERLAEATAVLQSAPVQQRIVTAVQESLGKHATFTSAGTKEGAEHVTLTLPARDAGKVLAAALRPVQRQIGDLDLSVLEKAPNKKVVADLAIRHDTLSTLTVDLGQFDEGRAGQPAKLPLKLTFAPGEALAVAAPPVAEKLNPQDLLAALTYAAMRSPELSKLL